MTTTQNQVLTTPKGNKCGHNPKEFRVIDKAHPFNCINKILLELKKLASFKKRMDKIFKHPAKINRVSKEHTIARSELKEACILVGGVYISCYDIDTGHVYANLSHKQVAKMAGISISRVKAAVAFFKEMGWMTVTAIKKKTSENEYKSEKAIKKIHPKFFLDLVGEFYFKSIVFTRERFRKFSSKSKKVCKNIMSHANDILSKPKVAQAKTHPSIEKRKTADQAKAEIEMALYRQAQNPLKSLGDYLREIQQEKLAT